MQYVQYETIAAVLKIITEKFFCFHTNIIIYISQYHISNTVCIIYTYIIFLHRKKSVIFKYRITSATKEIQTSGLKLQYIQFVKINFINSFYTPYT
jgi:hypothetical protein